MKLGTSVLTIIFLVMNINSAFADRRHNHYQYNNHYRNHGHSYNAHRHNRFRHYNHWPRRHYSHYHTHGHYAAYALGGLVIGGILGTIINNNYSNESQHSNYNVKLHTTPSQVNIPIKSSFILQPDGSCYVIDHVSNGSLILSPVSSGNCQ